MRVASPQSTKLGGAMPVSIQTIRRERATIEDVAASAGVSVATVSRALRGLPNVASHTRERIERIATELDYRADPAASRLAAGRSRAIAVAVPMLDGWYFSHVVAGVEAVFADAGYDTIVVGLGAYGEGRRVLEAAGPIYRRVDGLICVDAALNDDEFVRLRGEGMAIVYIGPDGPGVPSLGIDDVEVGRLATSHLLTLGHRRIGVINGQPEDGSVAPYRRQQGFELAFAEAGLRPDPSLYAPGYFDIAGGYDALRMLFARPDPPTAVFAFSDEMAFGVLWAARELGFSVPDDLSVVGVDDHDGAPVVGLTTVHQDVAEHGAHAARAMIELLSGREVSLERQNAPIRLVQRFTTAPPPGLS
jgi:LacI family transcriptional regulator, repressor for deo operon, udp, cdd, tsx, nupC, and nupG